MSSLASPLARRGSALLPVALALVVASARPAEAQPVALASSCVAGGGELALCLAAGTAAHSLSGHSALLAGLGSPVPGTASNLGTRVGGGPRISVFAQPALTSWSIPSASDPAAERSGSVPGLRLGAAVGVFEGVRLAPTVGGFLAVDLFADATVMLPAGSGGYDRTSRAYSVGARVGVFREGFTVPGLSVSIARRFDGAVTYGDVDGGDAIGAMIEPAVTSFRAAVSKDLFAVELLAGLGWDDLGGDATIEVPDGAGRSIETRGSLDGSRRLYFGSATMTFSLVLSLSIEAGYADGLSSLPGYQGDHDPTSGRMFGSFSARLVL